MNVTRSQWASRILSNEYGLRTRRTGRVGVIVALGIILFCILARLPLVQSYPFPLVYAFVVIGAWYGDVWDGLLSAVLGIALSAIALRHTSALFVAEVVVAFISLGLILLIQGLRRAQRAEARARASEAHAAAILEAALDCIITMDHTGRVRAFNPAAERTFGYRRADAIGQDLAALIIPPHLRARHRDGLARYLSSGVGPVLGNRLELTAMRADGTEFPVELTVTRLAGEPAVFTGYLRDITAQRDAELERAALLASEREAREEAEAAARQREDLVNSVSHDLKNPLAAIHGRLQLLRRQLERGDTPYARVTANLTHLDGDVGRMARLIDELLDSARLDAGQPLAMDQQPTDLIALTRQVVARTRDSAARPINVEASDDALCGSWDAHRLERVLDNLLSNALKYSPDGRPVTVRVRSDDDGHALLDVSDQGVGIPEADLKHIFERFHRAGNVGRTAGTGIGLAGARQIVEQHGGTIAIDSKEGVGTTVRVRLPVRQGIDAV